MSNFYAGQTDYIDKLNILATAAEVTDLADLASTITSTHLGSKASPPSTNNSGEALVEGIIYWDSTLLEMRVWNGTYWVPVANAETSTAGVGPQGPVGPIGPEGPAGPPVVISDLYLDAGYF